MGQVVTISLIILIVIVSIRAFDHADFRYKMMLYPYKIKRENQIGRFFTHMLIHGDFLHLFFNMYVLYYFGRIMEASLLRDFGNAGYAHYLILIIAGGVFAAQIPYFRNQDNPGYMSLGASGAVSAVVFATILYYPDSSMGFLFLPVEIPSWLFGLLYLGFEYYMSKRGGTTIAHDAHFGGAIFGIAYIVIINFPVAENFVRLVGGKLGFV
jgi:membrane associated rhomboid family serine protease